jgi:hypothetical protein
MATKKKVSKKAKPVKPVTYTGVQIRKLDGGYIVGSNEWEKADMIVTDRQNAVATALEILSRID